MFFFDAGAPPVGTVLYAVFEHLYYAMGHAGPLKEYVVFTCKIEEYLAGPRKLMRLQGRAPEGYVEVKYASLSDLGTKVFFTAREAAELAKAMTEDYEKRWAFTEQWGDIPLRRPWESLLKEETYHENHQE